MIQLQTSNFQFLQLGCIIKIDKNRCSCCCCYSFPPPRIRQISRSYFLKQSLEIFLNCLSLKYVVSDHFRLRKQNTKATVPLDVAPERRIERFPPKFRPVGRFWELRFRYLSSSTGREGEINRPPEHMRQIPFIHSARLL